MLWMEVVKFNWFSVHYDRGNRSTRRYSPFGLSDEADVTSAGCRRKTADVLVSSQGPSLRTRRSEDRHSPTAASFSQNHYFYALREKAIPARVVAVATKDIRDALMT